MSKGHLFTQRKSRFRMVLLLCCLGQAATNAAIEQTQSADEQLRRGKHFIPTKVYTAAQDAEILRAFEDLRVADVSDGMDKVGLANIGLMSPAILPLWKDTKAYKHRFIGIAVTVRYVPTNKAADSPRETQAFDRWVGNWYNRLSSEPFMPLIRQGTALVMDDALGRDVGSIGSNNIMAWTMRGCVGVVTNATARDTDEIATQQIPLYFRQVGRGIRPGRNEIESVNRPIVCGGVLVEPGDVIVADGDGVVVVPRAQAKKVAQYAHETLKKDKAGRKQLYKQLGLPPDKSVE